MNEIFHLNLTEAETSPDLFIALFWPHYMILNAEDAITFKDPFVTWWLYVRLPAAQRRFLVTLSSTLAMTYLGVLEFILGYMILFTLYVVVTREKFAPRISSTYSFPHTTKVQIICISNQKIQSQSLTLI